jgi:CheY-like chemotaxis protein
VLAGGVAHDFNNILTVVLGNAGLARKVIPADSPAAPLLDQIEPACERAADLCRQLLAYAGRGQVAAARTDLNDLVRTSAPLLEVPASRRAAVRFELPDGVPPIQADPGQVRQVLMNLVMNAAEAVADAPGEVRVATGTADVPAEVPPGYHLPPAPGRYVRLAVSDTGPGVPADVRPRMFDPFFTTKFTGRGLGLAAVLGIVRAHAGAIRVDSGPGRGTTVEVLWPAADARTDPGRPAPVPAPRSPVPRPAGLALVVDDEMFVREVTASALEEIGYQPLLAGDGRAGLEMFHSHRDDVRVAVIDVVMPGMQGDQLLDELRALAPELPAVLVSGFTDRRIVRPGIEFLQKPFHPEELMAAVRRVVSAAAAW